MEETMKSSYFKRTGHERYRVAKKNSNSAAVARRSRAMKRLEAQLKAGTKPHENGLDEIALDEKDRKRIQKEIEVLKGRV